VLAITVPELPPAMKEQMEQSLENDPDPEECITEAVARKPGVELFDPRGEGKCTLRSFKMAGGRLSGYYPGCATARALARFGSRPANDPASSERVLALLEKRREQLDQIRGALRIRAMLEIWLFIHIPLTIALIAALTAHVISVFYYW